MMKWWPHWPVMFVGSLLKTFCQKQNQNETQNSWYSWAFVLGKEIEGNLEDNVNHFVSLLHSIEHQFHSDFDIIFTILNSFISISLALHCVKLILCKIGDWSCLLVPHSIITLKAMCLLHNILMAVCQHSGVKLIWTRWNNVWKFWN